jgi:hypothetical protein
MRATFQSVLLKRCVIESRILTWLIPIVQAAAMDPEEADPFAEVVEAGGDEFMAVCAPLDLLDWLHRSIP